MPFDKLFQSDTPKEVVLVTGASGFLGQYIVKLLHKNHKTRHVRTLDCRPFKNHLGFVELKSTDHFTGDIRQEDNISEAFKDVTTVIHAAGLIDYSAIPDTKTLNDVNVKGTENVINACKNNGVKRLIFTSTVDVILGNEELNDADEYPTVPPKEYVYPGYSDSKLEAEYKVLEVEGIQTVVLRPTVMYGEQDPYFVPKALKMAAVNGGVFPRIGNGTALMQQTYVGNAAAAHVAAMETLIARPSMTRRVYNITDNTPVQNYYSFFEFFLLSRNCTLSTWYIPIAVVYWLLIGLQKLLGYLKPVLGKRANMAYGPGTMIHTSRTATFSRERARKELGYYPKYTYNDAVMRSNNYYMGLELN